MNLSLSSLLFLSTVPLSEVRPGDVKFGRSSSFLLRRRCRPEWGRKGGVSACRCRLLFVFMALLSFDLGSSSGSWRQVFSNRRHPWWMVTGGAGSAKSSFNKLGGVQDLRLGVVLTVAMVVVVSDAAGVLRLGLLRQPGAGLFWQGLVVVGWRLRSALWLRLEAATSWQRWLGEASPPMLGQRPQFRRLRRMLTAVLQRSVAAIEPQLLFGLRKARFFLRQRLDGVGVRRRAERWWSLKTSRGFFAISCFYSGLFALCHGQVAFGLLLVCAYVCCNGYCIPV